MSQYELYFIGILPPPTLQNEVTKLKYECRDKYHSSHALNAPPHLTIIPPFKCSSAEVENVVNELTLFSSSVQPFDLLLNGFGAFAPRVIYIHVEPSSILAFLQGQLQVKLSRTFSFCQAHTRPYHPHVTIAFKDLTPKYFEIAWPNFRSRAFSETFQCSELTLLVYNHHYWQPQINFRLGNEKLV